ncbi:MAG TPA: hypothetical protein VM433_09700, partial [Mycobacteriales bacterium]|nr:hypothetical protein [Mycobacteriales bacterium]
PAAPAPVGRGGGRSGPPVDDGAAVAVAVAERAPDRAAGVELLGSLVGSGYRRAPGLVRRGDGQTVQLTPLLYTLLDVVDGQRTAAELAAELGRRAELRVTAADVGSLLDKLRPLGLLRSDDGSEPAVGKANPLLALTCKVVITDPAVTRRITAPFAALFSPLVVVPVLALFAWTCWYVLVDQGLMSALSQAIYEPGLLLAVFVLTVASAGFHEFGHAAACRRGGATPGAMGFGLYVLWPAFYTDVDDSYRLGRRGRLLVDVGGLYFNMIVAVAFAGLALATGVEALLVVVATQLMQMVRQLAPFIRADGYHILADLTGVPDLFAHVGPTLKRLLPSQWARPAPNALKPWARVVVTAWVLVMVPLLVGLLGYLVHLLPRLAATAWDSIGRQVAQLGDDVAAGDPVLIAVRVLAVLSVSIPVLAISYLLVRIGNRVVRWVLGATEDRPRYRLAAMLAGAFLAAVAAGAWWPNGQYVPVQAADVPPAAAAGQGLGASPPAALPVADEDDATAAPGPARAAAVRATTDARAGVASARSTVGSAAAAPAPAGSTQAGAGSSTAPAPDPVVAGWGQVARGPAKGPDRGWAFPFPAPPPPGPLDNRAWAVTTRDRATVVDVRSDLRYVTDGSPVLHRNEAWALLACTDCTAVGVAQQTVVVVGQADVQAPVNLAAATNYDCLRCDSRAVASQLVVGVTSMPDRRVQARLRALTAQLNGLQGRARTLTVGQVHAELLATEAAVLQVLRDADLLATASRSTDADSAGDAAGPDSGQTAPQDAPGDDAHRESDGADPADESGAVAPAATTVPTAPTAPTAPASPEPPAPSDPAPASTPPSTVPSPTPTGSPSRDGEASPTGPAPDPDEEPVAATATEPGDRREDPPTVDAAP